MVQLICRQFILPHCCSDFYIRQIMLDPCLCISARSVTDPAGLKEDIKGILERLVLMQTYKANSAPYHEIQTKQCKIRPYFMLSKERAMLGLSYDVGCLNLRANRKHESLKKFGSIKCLIPACTGNDSLKHILYECQGYNYKKEDKGISTEFIDLLYKINQERKQRFMTSMINWSS